MLVKTFDKFLRDKRGHIVIGQRPNLPIVVWAVCAVASRLLHNQTIGKIGSIALIIWAVLELGWGVNYFRRGLGLVVLGVTLLNLF